MPRIKVETDIQLYCEQKGNGKFFVLISGLGVDYSIWSPVVNQLAEHFTVITDNRGVGQSDVPAGSYSIEIMAEDTIAWWEAIGIKQAVVVGHSMGGAILQQLCLSAPRGSTEPLFVLLRPSCPIQLYCVSRQC